MSVYILWPICEGARERCDKILVIKASVVDNHKDGS